MITLDVADLVVIAGQVLGIGPDAALDRLDLPAAQAALAEAAEAEGAQEKPGDAALAAAVLMRALLRHHPFPSQGQHSQGQHSQGQPSHNHSQQVAVAAGLQFLALNGWQADLDPPGTAVLVVEGLASGLMSPPDAAAWLSTRLSSYPAPPVREAPMRTRLPGRRLFRTVDPRPRAGVQTPVTEFIPFTDDTCKVVVLARQEATRLGLGHPGPEQFLTSLITTDQGVAAQALNRLGISPEAVRQQLTQISGQPPAPPGPDTPLALSVMPRALGEAVAQGHDYIATEHILLALFSAGDDTAARALASLGAGQREVRGAITAVTGNPGPIRSRHHQGRRPVARDAELRRLRREVVRLSDLLRDHGIDPGEPDRKIA